jgi:hypothetical protein
MDAHVVFKTTKDLDGTAMGSDVKIAFSYPYGDDLVEMKKWHFIDMCSCGCDGCYSKQMTPSTSKKEDTFAAIRVNLNAKAATAVIGHRRKEHFWANARGWCILPPPALGQRSSSGSALLPRVLICLPADFEWLSSLLKLFLALTLLHIFS